jgi:hypothetical protein
VNAEFGVSLTRRSGLGDEIIDNRVDLVDRSLYLLPRVRRDMHVGGEGGGDEGTGS